MPVLKVKEASNLETNTYGPRKLSSPPLALKKTLNEACLTKGPGKEQTSKTDSLYTIAAHSSQTP